MDVNKCLEKISQTINELEKLYPPVEDKTADVG